MTELFLDNNRVEISTDQSIKLSRENPSVTSSGDYTLDVECPLTMLNNRKFFGPWQRIDKRKILKPYAARLYVNNICIINGSAKVTAISNESVMIQLYGNSSEFNAVFGDLYIDELPLPFFYKQSGSFGGNRSIETKTESGYVKVEDPDLQINSSQAAENTFIFAPIYNESDDEIVNIYSSVKKIDGSVQKIQPTDCRRVAQFNLLYVLKCVFKAIGWKIDTTDYERSPFNHLYIASCISSVEMVHVLPHWTLKQFVTEVQNFFNCVFVFSSSSLEVTMAHVTSDAITKDVTLENEDLFNVDIEDDNSSNSRNAQTLHYMMSESEAHDTDYFDEEKIGQLPRKEYTSFDAMMEAYNAMTENDKEKFVFQCPEGDYCRWVYQGVADEKTKIKKFIHINQFGDLKRTTGENSLDLKICPVAIAESIPVPLYGETGGGHHGTTIKRIKDSFCYMPMPSLIGREKESSGTFVGGKQEERIILDTTEIQNLILSDGTTAGFQKPDRIEIFMWDGTVQQATEFEFSGRVVTVDAPATFTAYDHKDVKHVNHQKWSMTLKKEKADVLTLGQCHSGNEIHLQQRYTVRFISKSIPNPTDIFYINNKKFFSEKIEMDISNGKISPLMTGYFYEMK